MMRVVSEVGSALNGHRHKFLALLKDPNVTTILVEHRDRFCRFGADYVEAALGAQSRSLPIRLPTIAMSAIIVVIADPTRSPMSVSVA
jgi:predicted site-specific integrase-resolvase